MLNMREVHGSQGQQPTQPVTFSGLMTPKYLRLTSCQSVAFIAVPCRGLEAALLVLPSALHTGMR